MSCEIYIQSAIALSLGILLYAFLPDWNALGQVGVLMTLFTTAIFLVYTFLVVAFTPLSVIAYLLAMGFFFLQTVALLLALTHAYESFEAVTRVRWNRRADSIPRVPGYAPMVSFHVPAYNEPPEVLARTLERLAQLDYPNYEVLA